MSAGTYFVFLFSVVAIVFAAAVGEMIGVRRERAKAVEAGVAFWSVNPTNGETQFEYNGGAK